MLGLCYVTKYTGYFNKHKNYNIFMTSSKPHVDWFIIKVHSHLSLTRGEASKARRNKTSKRKYEGISNPFQVVSHWYIMAWKLSQLLNVHWYIIEVRISRNQFILNWYSWLSTDLLLVLIYFYLIWLNLVISQRLPNTRTFISRSCLMVFETLLSLG